MDADAAKAAHFAAAMVPLRCLCRLGESCLGLLDEDELVIVSEGFEGDRIARQLVPAEGGPKSTSAQERALRASAATSDGACPSPGMRQRPV
eukprot:CAMPEP_0180512038 /NCGR_PEP_ID=MMETSP1036_2-20121128/51365_1 /TAXON_ID=632150 /ORGANISM="Azadinium spinosum, Strain 3D9" /LENGTH=91 /DNA_ID=CAMNT_0022523131 /DNA_START=248 /DNA_END=521 /DNA_ORIENTATION=-